MLAFVNWQAIRPGVCSLEVQGLVRSEESHELWHHFNTDVSGLVNIIMSPGSWEVGFHVFSEFGTLNALVGGEYF